MHVQSVADMGFGLGLRATHYPYIFEHWPEVDWFEIISENFMDTDGRPKRNLARIKERYPIVMHGVAMSIGTIDPLNSEYLTKLKKLIDWVKPAWISDHLCWTGIAHTNSHDLLPLPYTEEALKHVVGRIRQVQDMLERPLILENPSTYLEFKSSTMPEAEFMARMIGDSGCHLLLDVNNVYVTCFNHRLDPQAYIDTLPLEHVAQIHLSGHTHKGTHIIDTHDDHVVDEVWALYKYVVHRAGRTPNTMVEWDDNIPEFTELYAELEKAKAAANDAANYGVLPDLRCSGIPHTRNHQPRLADEQALMQQAIVLGSTIDTSPAEWIRSKEAFAPHDQLAVYVNAYRLRLYDVVAEDFPALEYCLGKERSQQLIKDFIENVPSEHFNIGRYANQLAGFLQSKSIYSQFAYELCVLENALSQVADMQETLPLEPTHLEGMTPEMLMDCVLHPRKALQLFAFGYPVNAYYRDFKEDQLPEIPQPEKTYLAVFRHKDVMWRMELDENEYHLLGKLFEGEPVGAALESLHTELSLPEEELVGKLSQWFSRWMSNGLLAQHESVDQQQTRKKVA